MKYILLNFSYGYGPFLITTKLAVTLNNLLEKRTGKRFGIIVPLVYGDKQKQIMKEELGNIIDKHPNEIVLDNNLGVYLRDIFYGEKNYEESLVYYLKNYQKIDFQVKSYINQGLDTVTFSGHQVKIKKNEITSVITRAPRLDFGIRPAYHVSFAYISEILENAIKENVSKVDKRLFRKLIPIYTNIEQGHDKHFIASPATFFYLTNRRKRYSNEIAIPPCTVLPKPAGNRLTKKGIYVTITGVSCLEHVFEQARRLKLHIYTNKPEAIAGSEKAVPSIVNSPNVLLHFARSGWGSIWLSLLLEKPFITLPYNNEDDPEIYFNNACLKKTGLGKIYDGQTLQELINFRKDYNKSIKILKKYLSNKFGTLDGITYAANKIINYLNL